MGGGRLRADVDPGPITMHAIRVRRGRGGIHPVHPAAPRILHSDQPDRTITTTIDHDHDHDHDGDHGHGDLSPLDPGGGWKSATEQIESDTHLLIDNPLNDPAALLINAPCSWCWPTWLSRGT